MTEVTELVKYIASTLVSNPEEVTVQVYDEDGTHVVRLSVAASDMGKVIGRHGRIAKAIRTIVRAAALGNPERYAVEIVEESAPQR